MDALELLVDHRGRISHRLRRLTRIPGMPARRALLEETVAALDAHLTVKEQILYPRLPYPAARHLLEGTRRVALALADVLDRLGRVDVTDPDFRERIDELGARLERIAEHEEETLLPCVTSHLDDATLAAMGDEITSWLFSRARVREAVRTREAQVAAQRATAA